MRSTSLLSVFIAVLATAGRSQVPLETPPGSAPKAADEIPSAAPAIASSATTQAPRAISPEMAAKLRANAPKFTPPKPAETKAEELPDLRDTDKPRNGIIRLPQVMVQEQKLPSMKDRDLLTLSGKLDEAYRRHPGLRLGSLGSLSNNEAASAMLSEERRLERISEASEMIGLYQYSDPQSGAALKTLSIPLQRRSSEWVEAAGGPGHAISKLQ